MLPKLEKRQHLIPAAKKKGVGLVAGSPLQQGWLAKRYDERVRDDPPAWLAPQRREQLLRLYAYVDELGLTLPEVALRFVLSNPNVDVCITGPKNMEQMTEALATLDRGPMSEEELAWMRKVGDYVHG